MKIKDSFSRKVFNVCNVIFLLLICVTVLFPYLNTLAKSFNDGQDSARGGIVLWPRVFTWKNYETVLSDPSIMSAFWVSIAVTVIGTATSLLVTFITAYAMMHRNLVGRSWVMYLFLAPMYFGGGLIPQYILYSKIGLLNNFLVYIIPSCFGAYNMIIVRSYLNSIPGSLHEAASLDGANDLTIAFRILLPLAKPVMATVGLWNAVGLWNNWTTTMYFITKKELFTLQYVLVQVLKEAEKIAQIIKEAAMEGIILDIEMEVTSVSIQSAQLMITTLPIVCVYPFLQKYFIKGTTLGSVKD